MELRVRALNQRNLVRIFNLCKGSQPFTLLSLNLLVLRQGARKGHAGGVGRSRPIDPWVDSIGSLEEIRFWPFRMAPARRSFPGDRLGACVCVCVR